MSSSIGCLLTFLVMIFFYLLWPVMRIAGFLFGNPLKRKNTNKRDYSSNDTQNGQTNSEGKIFRADEGEYVDFEEIEN